MARRVPQYPPARAHGGECRDRAVERAAARAEPASNEEADHLIFKRVEEICAKLPIATSSAGGRPATKTRPRRSRGASRWKRRYGEFDAAFDTSHLHRPGRGRRLC